MTISVARWHTTYTGPTPPPDAVRRAWDEAPRRLDPRVAETDELVAIRAVEIGVGADTGDGAAELAARLERALADAVARALAGPADGETVLRFPDRWTALADLVVRAASGDLSRLWAHAALGLVPAEASGTAAFRAAAVAALAGEPDAVVPVLLRLAAADPATGSFTAVAAGLSRSEWHLLLAASPVTARFAGAEVRSGAAGATAAARVPSAAVPLVRWAAAQPALAASRRAEVARLLAGLLAPVTAGGDTAAIDAAAALLARAADGDIVHGALLPLAAPETATGDTRPPRVRATRDGPPAPARGLADPEPHEPVATVSPEAAREVATAWGGILFLLNIAEEAGLVARAEAAALAPADALAAVARATGASEDPLVAALSPAPPDLAAEGLGDLVAAFEASLAARLGPVPADEPCWLDLVCRRPARLSLEPGWIEATFGLETVDIRLRRAGLDLDPGFVPFLGAVVRFRYA